MCFEDNGRVGLSPRVLHVSDIGHFHELASSFVHLIRLFLHLPEDGARQKAAMCFSSCDIHDGRVALVVIQVIEVMGVFRIRPVNL